MKNFRYNYFNLLLLILCLLAFPVYASEEADVVTEAKTVTESVDTESVPDREGQSEDEIIKESEPVAEVNESSPIQNEESSKSEGPEEIKDSFTDKLSYEEIQESEELERREFLKESSTEDVTDFEDTKKDEDGEFKNAEKSSSEDKPVNSSEKSDGLSDNEDIEVSEVEGTDEDVAKKIVVTEEIEDSEEEEDSNEEIFEENISSKVLAENSSFQVFRNLNGEILFQKLKRLVKEASKKPTVIKLEGGDYEFTETLIIGENKKIEFKNADDEKIIFKRAEDFKDTFIKIAEQASLTLNGNTNESLVFDGKGNRPEISDHSGTMIESQGTLILNGVTFKDEKVNSKSEKIAPIHGRGKDSYINLKNGVITGNTFGKDVQFSAGGILLTDEAKMTMSGGEITNNKVAVDNKYLSLSYYNGGGITVLDGSEFIMKGGSIHNNTADIGAVFVGDSDIKYEDQLIEEMKTDEFGNIKTIYKIRDKENSRFVLSSGSIFENIGELTGALGILGHAEAETLGGELLKNSGFYSGAVFISDMYSGMMRLTSSGWKFFDSAWEHYQKIKDLSPKMWKDIYRTAFKFNGGSVIGNTATSGGTIQVLSDYVELNKGLISDNKATTGGAVFNEDSNNTVRIKNVYLEGNRAEFMWLEPQDYPKDGDYKTFQTGGAIWFCPTGDGQFYAENGMALFDNNAIKAGDDFSKEFSNKNVMVVLPERLPSGIKIEWYEDNSGTRYNPDEPIPYTKLVDSSRGKNFLKAIIPEEYKEVSKALADLHIIDNQAFLGGGIASNGTIIVGEIPDEDHPLKNFEVKKLWEEGTTPEEIKVEVRVKLKKDGKEIDYLLENIVLNKDNDFKYTIEGLPGRIAGYEIEDLIYIKELMSDDYNVIISPISRDSEPKEKKSIPTPKGVHNIYYKDLLQKITNEVKEECGDLIISKVVEGEENSDKEFNFTLVLKDKNNIELKEFFDYILSMADKVLKEGRIKSGDFFRLADGQRMRIKEIPYGTGYLITEEKNGDYETVAEGNIGTVEGKETFVTFTNTKIPDKPDEPDNPPDEPDKPNNPPETPDKPDKPNKPNNPPETPVVPPAPKIPETLAPPTPPETPVIPEKPLIPETPKKPEPPEQIVTVKTKKGIPRTGLCLTEGISAILLGLGVILLRKKNTME